MGKVLVDRDELARAYNAMDGILAPEASPRVQRDRLSFVKHIMADILLAQPDVAEPDPDSVTVKRADLENVLDALIERNHASAYSRLRRVLAIGEFVPPGSPAPTPPAPEPKADPNIVVVRKCNTCCAPYQVGERGSTDKYCHRCAPGEAELASRQPPDYVTREELDQRMRDHWTACPANARVVRRMQRAD